jgi:hypothetical protein
MTRILIADGCDVVRRLLKLLIASRAGWVVCGEATEAAPQIDDAGESEANGGEEAPPKVN